MIKNRISIKKKILDCFKDKEYDIIYSDIYNGFGRTMYMIFEFVLDRNIEKKPPTVYERQSIYRTIRNMFKKNDIIVEKDEETNKIQFLYLVGLSLAKYNKKQNQKKDLEEKEELISLWCMWCKKEVMVKSLENHLQENHKISLSRYNRLFN